MIFSSLTFLIFYLAVLFVLLLTGTPLFKRIGREKLRSIRHFILLAASYLFYGWWDGRFCLLMFLLTFVSWLCSAGISRKFISEKFCLTVGVSFSLAVLAFFKYTNFFIDSFTRLFHLENPGTLNIILPVGISFYTFQALSYLVDVYRKRVPTASFSDLALYIAFFPQLVAGPIVKASYFLPQLKEDRFITNRNLSIGAQIFLFGLFKKTVLADWISVFVDSVYAYPKEYSGATLLLAVTAYSLQIYFDFSAYSDMAVGCAKGLGYDLPRNFNMPYLSKNPSEFWKRWHISLSTWLGEYLYIPLGGNRKGKGRTYLNLLLTMLLGGLWHGANWTFVLWGGLHGAALCFHKFFQGYFSHVHKSSSRAARAVQSLISVILLNIFVSFCWIFFRAGDFTSAFTIIKRILLMEPGINYPHFWSLFALCILILSSLAAVCRSFKKPNTVKGASFADGFYPILDLRKFRNMILFWTFFFLILVLMHTGANPFIYFQF